MSDTETTETPVETTPPAAEESAPAAAGAPSNLDFLLDVPVKLSAELGSCKMTMQELLDLDLGTVVQLDKPANANVDVYVNQKLVARGEVVVAEDNFGIRIKEIVAKPA
ncbi:MAG: flagellar motor switch protein FliN [Verrucomicrobiota bacterium]|nr:flagellar motor switch protein FliN [Verrucomicrobiota bacterium]